jgi:hypothetical protein
MTIEDFASARAIERCVDIGCTVLLLAGALLMMRILVYMISTFNSIN